MALAVGWSSGHAGDPPARAANDPVDPGLLEFLGSGDPSSDSAPPDDGSWMAYLSQVNIGKVAKTARTPPAPAQPRPATSPPGGDKPSG